MIALINKKETFEYLDVAQLIKHFFGICNNIDDKERVLVYVYWESDKVRDCNPIKVHRDEITRVSNLIEGDKLLSFKSISYQKLWESWMNNTPNDEVCKYINILKDRYTY